MGISRPQYYYVLSDIADQYYTRPRPMTAFGDVFTLLFIVLLENPKKLLQNRPEPEGAHEKEKNYKFSTSEKYAILRSQN